MSETSSRYTRVIAASETDYGVDEVNLILTTATRDIVYQNLRNVSIQPVLNPIEINRTRGSHSGVPHKVIKNQVTVSCEIPLTGWVSGDAGEEAPSYAPFLKAANLREVIVAATSATYNPATVNQASMTLYVYEMDLETATQRLTVVTGVRGNLTFNFNLDGECFATFEGIGIYNGEQSVSAAFFNATTGAAALLKDGSTAVTARTTGTETVGNTDPVMATDMTFTTAAAEPYRIGALTLGTNWGVTPVQSINSSANTHKVLLTRGDASRIGGSFTLNDGDVQDDLIDRYESADADAMNIVATGGDGSSGQPTITIVAPAAQIGPATKGDNAGVRTYDVPWFANGTWTGLTADNDFTLVYGEVA